MVEFVPSYTLASVLADHKTIGKFLSQHNPDPAGPFGMQSSLLDGILQGILQGMLLVHHGTRSEAAAPPHEALQGDGGGNGWHSARQYQ
eukprot:367466-Prorocentrum_minimum.AAC.1